MDPSYSYRRSEISQLPKHQVQLSSYFHAPAKPIQGFSGFIALEGRMTAVRVLRDVGSPLNHYCRDPFFAIANVQTVTIASKIPSLLLKKSRH
jgi:hypothetical protein